MDQEELAGWGSNTEWADSTGVTAVHCIELQFRKMQYTAQTVIDSLGWSLTVFIMLTFCRFGRGLSSSGIQEYSTSMMLSVLLCENHLEPTYFGNSFHFFTLLH